MDERLLTRIEEALEAAIEAALTQRRIKGLPFEPPPHVSQMMAKAAAAVYEAVALDRDDDGGDSEG